jgi:hypothetical protein
MIMNKLFSMKVLSSKQKPYVDIDGERVALGRDPWFFFTSYTANPCFMDGMICGGVVGTMLVGHTLWTLTRFKMARLTSTIVMKCVKQSILSYGFVGGGYMGLCGIRYRLYMKGIESYEQKHTKPVPQEQVNALKERRDKIRDRERANKGS